MRRTRGRLTRKTNWIISRMHSSCTSNGRTKVSKLTKKAKRLKHRTWYRNCNYHSIAKRDSNNKRRKKTTNLIVTCTLTTIFNRITRRAPAEQLNWTIYTTRYSTRKTSGPASRDSTDSNKCKVAFRNSYNRRIAKVRNRGPWERNSKILKTK